MALACFASLGFYLRNNERRYFRLAVLLSLVSAVTHPFEIFVIVTAGSAAILLCFGLNRKTTADVILLGGAALAGLLPYLVMTLRHQWLFDVSQANRWQPPTFLDLLRMLGPPVILALPLALFTMNVHNRTDLLLKLWVICALVGLYVPWVPHSQHLMDGLHYAVAMLVVRQLVLLRVADRLSPVARRGAVVLVGILSIDAVVAYGAYYRQSFIDGHSSNPQLLLSSVAPRDVVETIRWLSQNGAHHQLVWASPEHAAAFATIPMHSFASHSVFSISFAQQQQCSKVFFKGKLSETETQQLLNHYGIHWLIVPSLNTLMYLPAGSVHRASIGQLSVWEFPSREMKPYGSAGDFQCAQRP
jgi:hypothetical protein